MLWKDLKKLGGEIALKLGRTSMKGWRKKDNKNRNEFKLLQVSLSFSSTLKCLKLEIVDDTHFE